MSYNRQNNSFGSYNNYQPEGRRNSNSFSGEQNYIKRRKFQNRKRLQSRDSEGDRNFSPNKSQNTFKEPLPPGRSPVSSRPNPFRSPAREYLDSVKSPTNPQNKKQKAPTWEQQGPPWSWDVFNRECKAWQDKHKLAYYKSRCMALEFENQMLFQQIQTLIDENGFLAVERGVMPSMLVPNLFDKPEQNPAQESKDNAAKKQGKTRQNKPKTTTTSNKNSSGGDDIDFEIPEDMMACIEKSMRHKLSLKREQPQKTKVNGKGDEKDKENKEDKKDGPKQPMGQKRQEELEQLYGKNASLIQGLETSLQLNFNRNCDTHNPKLTGILNHNLVEESDE